MASDEFSRDSLFDGRLVCLQPRDGYRFSVDAVLLAHFISPKRGERILDIGTGCGIVSLLLAYRNPETELTAIEVQPKLAALARENFRLNGFENRCSVIEGDCRAPNDLIKPGKFDWVVSNPPYRKTAVGRQNLCGEEAVARHEISVDLAGVLEAAATALRTKGRAAIVYPASRGAALIAGMRQARLEPKRLRIVYSYPGGEGKILLVEAVRNGGEELQVLPPFYVYTQKDGVYTHEMARLYAP